MAPDPLNSRESMAFIFLQSFIKDGFPTPDPEKQIAVAFIYADAWLKFKNLQHPIEETEPVCPECHIPLAIISLASQDAPNAYAIVCSNTDCKMYGKQEYHER
jgi:hypothetical protein